MMFMLFLYMISFDPTLLYAVCSDYTRIHLNTIFYSVDYIFVSVYTFILSFQLSRQFVSARKCAVFAVQFLQRTGIVGVL